MILTFISLFYVDASKNNWHLLSAYCIQDTFLIYIISVLCSLCEKNYLFHLIDEGIGISQKYINFFGYRASQRDTQTHILSICFATYTLNKFLLK